MLPSDLTYLKPSPNYAKVLCEKTWRWDTTAKPLPDFDLWYAWGGEGQLVLNGTSYSVSQGSCFLFRPGDRTFATHNPANPLTVTFLHFSLQAAYANPPMPSAYRAVRDTLLFETYLNRFVQRGIARTEVDNVESRLLLALMLVHLLREEEKRPNGAQSGGDPLQDLILQIAHRIRQNPAGPYAIPDLAAQAKLSPRYFSLKFKEVMEETIEHYLIRIRIERAEHLLRHNGMNVTEVADALGYRNIHFFSRQFKQYRGINPSEVRR